MTFRPVPKPDPKRKHRRPTDHPYIRYAKGLPCEGCGTPGPNDFAHVEGPLSTKTNQPLPRRNGPAYVSGIPLCPACHQTDPNSIHNIGEAEWSTRRYGRPDGAARTAFRHLAHWTMTRATV